MSDVRKLIDYVLQTEQEHFHESGIIECYSNVSEALAIDDHPYALAYRIENELDKADRRS